MKLDYWGENNRWLVLMGDRPHFIPKTPPYSVKMAVKGNVITIYLN